MSKYDLPSPHLLRQQSEWLAPARARALRRAGITRRKVILDLACGCGAVTGELVRRSNGLVIGLDIRRLALDMNSQAFAGATRICGDAFHLPFANEVFDLVFCQFAFLWLDAQPVIKEIGRVLQSQGVLVAIEPDYGGMIEYPPEIGTREIWTAALTRAGADPLIGRKLPGFLQNSGWSVEVAMLDRLMPPSPERFALLGELPLTEEEKNTLARAVAAEAALPMASRLAHLPMFIIFSHRVYDDS